MRPLGSVYHYFPGGKEQIGVEALARVGRADPDGTIASAGERRRRPRDAINAYFVYNAERLRDSDYERGLPDRDRGARDRRATSSASARCARTCSTVGRPRWPRSSPKPASPRPTPSALATFVLSSYEGALTMSRALRDIQPMLTSGAAVASVLHAHLGDAPRAG